MKLLFDQNISHRLVNRLLDIYPECTQVKLIGLENKDDYAIWDFARKNDYSVVTFDVDFYDLTTLKGLPPKIVWLRVGNKTSDELEQILKSHKPQIEEFIISDDFKDVACLEIH